MRTGRPIPPLTITNEERETLERWARRPTTAQAVAQRARLILSCAPASQTRGCPLCGDEADRGQMAHALSGEAARRLAGRAPPGAPRTVSDADVERVLTRTLETRPADATHWSTGPWRRPAG